MPSLPKVGVVLERDLLTELLEKTQPLIRTAGRAVYQQVSFLDEAWCSFFPRVHAHDLESVDYGSPAAVAVVNPSHALAFDVDERVGQYWREYGEPLDLVVRMAEIFAYELRLLCGGPAPGARGVVSQARLISALLSSAALTARRREGEVETGLAFRSLLSAMAAMIVRDASAGVLHLCPRCQEPFTSSAHNATWCSRCAEAGRKQRQRARRKRNGEEGPLRSEAGGEEPAHDSGSRRRVVTCEEAGAICSARLRGQRVDDDEGGVIQDVSFPQYQCPAGLGLRVLWRIRRDFGRCASRTGVKRITSREVRGWCAEALGLEVGQVALWLDADADEFLPVSLRDHEKESDASCE